MDKISVNENTAEVIEFTTKAFLGKVLEERVKLKGQKKRKLKDMAAVQVNQETAISQEKSIFDKCPRKKLKKLSDNKPILPKKNNQPSYESYRHIFNTQFNISFGYPRMDTCSTCDTYLVKDQGGLKKKKNWMN